MLLFPFSVVFTWCTGLKEDFCSVPRISLLSEWGSSDCCGALSFCKWHPCGTLLLLSV